MRVLSFLPRKMFSIEERILFLLISAVCQTGIFKDCFTGDYCDCHIHRSSDVSFKLDEIGNQCYILTMDFKPTETWIEAWYQSPKTFEFFDFPFANENGNMIYCDRRVIRKLDVKGWIWVEFDPDEEDHVHMYGLMCLDLNSTFDPDDLWGSLYREREIIL